jgi:hypothetical protein
MIAQANEEANRMSKPVLVSVPPLVPGTLVFDPLVEPVLVVDELVL